MGSTLTRVAFMLAVLVSILVPVRVRVVLRAGLAEVMSRAVMVGRVALE